MWPGHFCEIGRMKRCSLCIEQDNLAQSWNLPRSCGVKQMLCLGEVLDCVDLVWLIIWMIRILVFLPKTASATHTSVHPVYKHDHMLWRLRSLKIHHDKLYFFNTTYAKSQRWSELRSKTLMWLLHHLICMHSSRILPPFMCRRFASLRVRYTPFFSKWFDLCV